MLAFVLQHIAEHVVQDAVVAAVGELGRRVDTAPAGDHLPRAVSAGEGHRHRGARL